MLASKKRLWRIGTFVPLQRSAQSAHYKTDMEVLVLIVIAAQAVVVAGVARCREKRLRKMEQRIS